MSATITLDSQPGGMTVQGATRVRHGTINLGVYATNGVAVAASDFVFAVQINDLRVDPSAGIVFEYDKTNGKVKAYRQKDPAAAGGADIALPEVANAVDLSAVVSRFRAAGI